MNILKLLSMFILLYPSFGFGKIELKEVRGDCGSSHFSPEFTAGKLLDLNPSGLDFLIDETTPISTFKCWLEMEAIDFEVDVLENLELNISGSLASGSRTMLRVNSNFHQGSFHLGNNLREVLGSSDQNYKFQIATPIEYRLDKRQKNVLEAYFRIDMEFAGEEQLPSVFAIDSFVIKLN